MKWIYHIFIFGFLVAFCVSLHHSRGKVDLITVKVLDAEVNIYLMPSTLGFEYYSETYVKYSFKYSSWKYQGMPFLGFHSREDVSLDKYPRSAFGHIYWRYYFGGWPHLGIAFAFPLWVPIFLVISSYGILGIFRNWQNKVRRSISEPS